MTVQESKLGLGLFHGLRQWNIFCLSLDLCLETYQEAKAKTIKRTPANALNAIIENLPQIEAQTARLCQQ